MGRKVFIVLLCTLVVACAVFAGKVIAQASSESERMEDSGPIPPEDMQPSFPSRQTMGAAVSQGASDTAKKLDDILAALKDVKSALSDVKKELNTVKIRVTQSQ